MDNPEEQLKTDAEKVYLLRAEKDAIRRRILSMPTIVPHKRVSSFVFFSRLAVAPLALLLLIGGPVAYAAQTSGPGDLLFSLEINFIEPVQEILQSSPEGRVEFHTARLEERLDELQFIQTSGEELNPSDYVAVSENVSDHVGDISTALASSTPTETKIKTLVKSKALVEAHEEILEDLHADTNEVGQSSNEVSEVLIETSEDYVSQNSEETVESIITEAVDDINDIASSTATTTQEVIQDQIEDIEAAIDRGNLKQALDLTNETQAEVLKDQYLSEDVILE